MESLPSNLRELDRSNIFLAVERGLLDPDLAQRLLLRLRLGGAPLHLGVDPWDAAPPIGDEASPRHA